MESAASVASRIAGQPTRSSVTGNTFAMEFTADKSLFDAGNRANAAGADTGTRTGALDRAPGYREEHRPSASGDGHRP